MDKKEEFKRFASLHPSLIKHIKNKSMTWQKFYEMYDMDGENSIIWDPYRTNSNPSQPSSVRYCRQDFL